MAEDDSDDSVSGGRGRDARRAELEQLFAQWDQRKGAPGADAGGEAGVPAAEDDDADDFELVARPRIDVVHLRITFTALLAFVAGYVMWYTAPDFLYWLNGGSKPVDLGNLAERYQAGDAMLEAGSNRWVEARGLFTTYESQSGPEEEPVNFFLCPMYRIVVRTDQPFPDKQSARSRQFSIPLDPAYAKLVLDKQAFPEDFTASVDVSGRLVRASEAPRWAKSGAKFYVVRLGVQPEELWMLLDGDQPADHQRIVVLWALAPCAPLISAFFLWRAVRRRRRRR